MYIDQVLKFTDTLIDYIRHVTAEVDALFSDILREQGLTLLQSRVLTEIKKSETLAVGTLADRLHLNPANTSNMCKKLEQAGFIRRFRNKSDERVVLVALTERGAAAMEAIDGIIRSRYAEVMKNTDPKDFDTLKLGMDTVERLLHQMHEANQKFTREAHRHE
ncbi:MAG: MarR family transcriptional regulator [Eubacterium sp.]|nr:MarR family transcriptional regulator [Eubacterium sp.]